LGLKIIWEAGTQAEKNMPIGELFCFVFRFFGT